MGKLYLCKPNRVILGSLTGLIEDSCSLTTHTADIWELSFDVYRYITDEYGNYVQSDYYEAIAQNMELYLETEQTCAFFRIDSNPIRKNDGIQETTSVTAHSIECELQNKILNNFKANCGTIDSLEYLAAGINNYTQKIEEWVSLVNYENHALSLLHMAIEKSGATWSIADNLDTEICSKKLTFDINSQDIYSFLMNDVSNAARVIFDFDRKNKIISFKPVEELGEDTGIVISMKNLMKDFEISSTSSENIITKYTPRGANNLGIEYVNFGEDYILNLDYFMNATNEYGHYQYVSSELHDKYKNWINFRDNEKITYDGISGERTRREWYAYFTKQYNSALMSKNELTNRVPNDGCNIDYTTYKYEELEVSLRAYMNAVASLLTIYRNEYNIPDGTPTDENALKETVYWNDYYAYQYKIIPSVKEAMKLYCDTDANGNLKVDGNGNYIVLDGGNPAYNKGDNIVKSIDNWLYEWELYGLDELEAKRKAWIEVAVLLRKDEFFKSNGTLRTPDVNGWNELTDTQKQTFTGYSAYVAALNSYLDYYAISARSNSLTGTITNKGILLLCDDAILERKAEIAEQESVLNQIDVKRKDLAASVNLKSYSDNDGNKIFSSEDLQIIELLIKEAAFQNNNILTTNLDDIATTVDAQELLYQDSMKQLYIESQPQYSFSCNIDNLFHLDEFKPFADNFKLNNYIYVNTDIYKELMQKVRVITITYNPLIVTEDIDIGFSTMTKSLEGMNDFKFLLNECYGYSGSSYSSSSGGGGTYGTNDAEIQIANTMLNALLSTETFGTSVSNVILDTMSANKGEFRRLFANSGAFYGLETGELKVSGQSLIDKIESFNYEAGKNGSKLELSDGTFEFAGGRLKWNGKELTISGYANDTDVTNLSNNLNNLKTGLSNGTTSINGGCLKTGNIVSQNYNIPYGKGILDNTTGSILCLNDGKFNFGGGKLKWDGTHLTIEGSGKFSGEVNATSGNFTGNVNADTLNANKSGTIAGWTFSKNGFYKNSPIIAGSNGMYLGDDGFSINDYCVVNQNGLYFKSKSFIPPQYDSSISTRFCDIKPGQYIRVYLYNMGNIEYFELSFNYSYQPTNGDPKDDEYKIRGWGTNGRTTPEDSVMQYDGNDVKIFYQPYSEIFPMDCDEYGINIHKVYSMGRNINGRWFNKVQIGKIEICNSNGEVLQSYDGAKTSDYSGFMINSYTKKIFSDNYYLSNEKFMHKCVYSSTTSSSSNVCISLDGTFQRSTSSSKRYKTDITSDIHKENNPENLYDITLYEYKYKDLYLSPTDQRYQKNIIGFLAEDVYKKYPIACNLDKDGKPEMWNINILFPAALKLIQNQHKEIKQLEKRMRILEQAS